MAYTNINLRKPNMTVANNCFYMFDAEWDTLVEKIDDGSISFTYPLDIDLSRSYIEDDFTGNDGDPPNSDIWLPSDPGVTIQNNKLELHVDSVDVSEYVYLVQSAYGNFDVQVDYELITYPSTHSWQSTLTVERPYPGWRYRMIRGYSTALGHYYAAQDFDGSSYTNRATASTTDTSGKLRLYRSGTSIGAYYWSGTAWTQLYNWSGGLTDRLSVRIYNWSGVALPSVTTRFDNFSFHHRLGYVRDTQYDGKNFWTFQRIENNGYVIRRWNIENYICRLRDEFLYGNTSSSTYASNTFGVEHYITEFDCTVSGGNDVLCLDEYYDSTVSSGVTLFLGPNENSEQEEVTVSGVIGSDVIITSGTQYIYKSGDNINFYKSFFVFNDYDGISSAKGTLYRFDAYTGEYMSSQADVEYKSITASTFKRVKNALQDYPDMHTLLYIKDTNAKLRNMSDLLSTKYASSVNDDFTGADYDAPNTTRWSVVDGDPHILNNKLFMNSLMYDDESISSNYEIIGDFDVQVSGVLNGFTTASGYSNFEHYMKINFPHNSNNNCELGVNYYDVPSANLVAEYMMDSISGTVLYDTSGNGKHGVVVGSPTTVSGITGNALKFRGISQQDGVTLLYDTDAGNVENLFFLSVWFKSETTGGDTNARVMSRDCSDYWCIRVNQSTAFPQQLYFYYSDTQSINLGSVIQQDTWHHIMAYWDVANTTCKLYLDNTEMFSTTSLAAFTTADRDIVIGCNSETGINPSANQFEGPIDDVRFYNRVLTSGERECLYNHSPNDKVFLYTALNDAVTNDEVLTSGTSSEYLFRLTRSDDTMNFYYKTVVSGVMGSSWTSFGSQTMYDRDCTLSLGLESILTSVSGTYFDDLIFNSGKIFYPSDTIPYYGTMILDNVRADQVTIIPVYNVAIYGKTLYRLQDEATYYGADNDWGALYNYQISPIRSFLDSVVVTAYPAIVPANAYNTVEVTAVVANQYGEGVVYKPVYFTDTDSVGYITINPVYTDVFFGTGRTNPTYYKSGIVPATVTIEGTATQYD